MIFIEDEKDDFLIIKIEYDACNLRFSYIGPKPNEILNDVLWWNYSKNSNLSKSIQLKSKYWEVVGTIYDMNNSYLNDIKDLYFLERILSLIKDHGYNDIDNYGILKRKKL